MSSAVQLVVIRGVGALALLWSASACGGDLGDAPGADPDASFRSADATIPLDAAVDAPLIPAACDDGDARVSDPLTGHCYLRFDDATDWNSARARCQAIGAYLASVTSAGEDAMLGSIAPPAGPLPTDVDAWFGANDVAAEGTWAWDVTGEPFAFMNFRTGEPNNTNPNDPQGEDCGAYEGDTNTWDDRSCTMTILKYYCEREPL